MGPGVDVDAGSGQEQIAVAKRCPPLVRRRGRGAPDRGAARLPQVAGSPAFGCGDVPAVRWGVEVVSESREDVGLARQPREGRSARLADAVERHAAA
jgi:hypothetical protein